MVSLKKTITQFLSGKNVDVLYESLVCGCTKFYSSTAMFGFDIWKCHYRFHYHEHCFPKRIPLISLFD